MKERSLRKRLARMNADELRAAMQATADGDRTHAADLWRRVLAQGEHAEVHQHLAEEMDLYLAVAGGSARTAERHSRILASLKWLVSGWMDLLSQSRDPSHYAVHVGALGPEGAPSAEVESEGTGLYRVVLRADATGFWLVIVVPADSPPWIPDFFLTESGHVKTGYWNTATAPPVDLDVEGSGRVLIFLCEEDFLPGAVDPEDLTEILMTRVRDCIVIVRSFGSGSAG